MVYDPKGNYRSATPMDRRAQASLSGGFSGKFISHGRCSYSVWGLLTVQFTPDILRCSAWDYGLLVALSPGLGCLCKPCVAPQVQFCVLICLRPGCRAMVGFWAWLCRVECPQCLAGIGSWLQVP